MEVSAEIVENFLENKLGISNWRSKLKEKKLEFLKEIVIAHGFKVCYQNASWCAIPVASRKVPTVEEVIYHGIHSAGAPCIHLNYFIMLILKYLGYDAFIAGAESPIWDIPLSHLITLVRLESSDSLTNEIYLVDLGFGRPYFEPVNLNRLPYTSRAGGYDFEYRFNPEKEIYERYSYLGCSIKGKFEEGIEGKVEYFFDLKPRKFDDFSECFKSLFVGNAPFMDGLFLFRFTRWESEMDFDYVACRNIVMIKGDRETYEETTFDSYESLLPNIKKYFPNLNWSEMDAAILHYNAARQRKLQEKAQVDSAKTSESPETLRAVTGEKVE